MTSRVSFGVKKGGEQTLYSGRASLLRMTYLLLVWGAKGKDGGMIFASAARCLIADPLWDGEGLGLRPPHCGPGLPERSPEEGILGGCWASSSRNSLGGVLEWQLQKATPPPALGDSLPIQQSLEIGSSALKSSHF